MAVTYNYGAAPTYVKIASQTPGAVTSVTFSNLPQGYTDLVVVVNGYTSNSNVGDNIGLRFNGDTGSNYSWTRMYAVGATGSTRSNSQTVIGQASLGGGVNYTSTITYHIQGYSNSSFFKTALYKSNDASTQVTTSVGTWRNTAPITSLTLNTYASGVAFGSTTTFTVYGIKAAVAAPKATGGDNIYTDGTYWYHQFRNSGVFSTKTAITADVMTVAGGGGGGSYRGGGGGAGGLVYSASQSLSGGYTVVVGGGGAAGIGNVGFATGLPGGKGGNSRFGSLTEAIGGGRGPTAVGGTNGEGQGAGNGGSGCGVPSASQTPGLGTSGQGNNGGAGWSGYSGNYGAGGGGGAGAAGSAGTSTAGGAGGAGSLYFGQYYAGGGGGGTYGGGTGGAGGSGVGGAGGANSNGVSAASATGSGGGGAGANNDTTTNNGGAGGSGIVIVRYAV